MEFPKAILAFVVVFSLNTYVLELAKDSVAGDISDACTTTGEFQVGDTTIHCGVIRKEVLAETLERKRERLKEECSNYVRGIE
jgi:hypothetical protein